MFDRAIAEGVLAVELGDAEQRGSMPYAAHGTIIHFLMQDGLRCTFPSDPAEFAPKPDEYLEAAELFDGDTDVEYAMARKVATLAAGHMPETLDGRAWLAEAEFDSPQVSGHIDFLSQDGRQIVDLKTTARKPIGGKPKPVHVAQVFTYRHLVEHCTGLKPETARLLYVDSLRANWVLPVDIDFTTEESRHYAEFLGDFLSYLNDRDQLFALAFPAIGANCADDFCPHTSYCRDRYMGFKGSATGTNEFGMPGSTLTQLGA